MDWSPFLSTSFELDICKNVCFWSPGRKKEWLRSRWGREGIKHITNPHLTISKWEEKSHPAASSVDTLLGTGISCFTVPYDPFSIPTRCWRLRWNGEGGMGLFLPSHWTPEILWDSRHAPASVCCHQSWGTVPPREWSPAIPPASHRVSLRVQVKPVSPGGCSESPAGQGVDESMVILHWGCSGTELSPSCCMAKQPHWAVAETGTWRRSRRMFREGSCVPSYVGEWSVNGEQVTVPGDGWCLFHQGCSEKLREGQCSALFPGRWVVVEDVEPCTAQCSPSGVKQIYQRSLSRQQEPWMLQGLLLVGHTVFITALYCCPLHHSDVSCLGPVPWQGLLDFPSVPDRCSSCSHLTGITHRCLNSGAMPPACCSCSAEQLNQLNWSDLGSLSFPLCSPWHRSIFAVHRMVNLCNFCGLEEQNFKLHPHPNKTLRLWQSFKALPKVCCPGKGNLLLSFGPQHPDLPPRLEQPFLAAWEVNEKWGFPWKSEGNGFLVDIFFFFFSAVFIPLRCYSWSS